MKCVLREYGIRMTPQEKQYARSRAIDLIKTRGTGRTPAAPRDLVLQSAPRGILVNWRPGEGFVGDVSGWRIYKDTEGALFQEIRDPNTMQVFVPTTAAATSPKVNIFVSAISPLGQESPMVSGQAAALAEAGAPAVPTIPDSFTQNYSTSNSGTANTSTRLYSGA